MWAGVAGTHARRGRTTDAGSGEHAPGAWLNRRNPSNFWRDKTLKQMAQTGQDRQRA
jgi:hypothetical protein